MKGHYIIFIWHALVFVAIALRADDLTMGLVNWYTVSIFSMVVGIVVFYPLMESKNAIK